MGCAAWGCEQSSCVTFKCKTLTTEGEVLQADPWPAHLDTQPAWSVPGVGGSPQCIPCYSCLSPCTVVQNKDTKVRDSQFVTRHFNVEDSSLSWRADLFIVIKKLILNSLLIFFNAFNIPCHCDLIQRGSLCIMYALFPCWYLGTGGKDHTDLASTTSTEWGRCFRLLLQPTCAHGNKMYFEQESRAPLSVWICEKQNVICFLVSFLNTSSIFAWPFCMPVWSV